MRRLLILSIVCLAGVACSDLYKKSDSDLRSEYLAITQPGTSMDEAVNLIKKKIHPEGPLDIRRNVPCQEREDASKQIGTHSIKVDLGWYYWGATKANKIGEWCFNADEKLINIIVYNSIDQKELGPDSPR